MTRSSVRPVSPTLGADPSHRWGIQDALELYHVPEWGKGYFGINGKGHLVALPDKQRDRAIDIKRLVDDLSERDVHPPVLLRFTDVLRHRVGEIAGAFNQAIADNAYQGEYCCVYPIKVNQQRRVVEEICDIGSAHGVGLEAGSKPELLAVLAMVGDRDVPIICNGFKDDEFVEMVVLAQKLGKRVIPVVEKFSELELLVSYAQRHGVKPMLGMRVKLWARGAGRWQTSGGVRSKFGLFVSEVLEGLEYLQSREMGDCLQLLHFHLGSQISNIRNIKDAVNELVRVYVQLAERGAGMKYIDIGGGLGVDYDGSQTNYESSINYTLAEYASDVVYRIKSVCDEAGVAHPTIISESGRAMVAYHSALIFDVISATGFEGFTEPLPVAVDDQAPQPLVDLATCADELSKRNLIESYHDAVQAYEQAMTLFNLGHLTLEQRALAERVYWSTLTRIQKMTEPMEDVPEELEKLPVMLSDIYFCNFSVFQSLPDSWAIDQLFPIMPIHRLDEAPTKRGTLADISCDSDGKIDRFIGARDDKDVLELHALRGEPYYLGAFLIGAYQEILGDMHNLFGDTHVVHVSIDAEGHVNIDQVHPGDTVDDVLSYVDFSSKQLAELMRRDVEQAVRRGKLSVKESRRFMRFYEQGLRGYTYLEDPSAE